MRIRSLVSLRSLAPSLRERSPLGIITVVSACVFIALPLALPVRASTPAPLPIPAPRPSTVGPANTILWNADFGTGDLSQWDQVHTGATGCGDCGNTGVTVVTAPARGGTYAAQLQAVGGGTSGRIRAELTANQSTGRGGGISGSDSYYSFSVYVPAASNAMWAPHFNVIAQWSVEEWERHSGGNGCSPPIAVEIMMMQGVAHLILSRSDESFDGTNCADDAEKWFDLGVMPSDTWVDLTFHVRFGTDASSGYVAVWKNGSMVLPPTGMRTELSTLGDYFEMDLYRDDFTGTQKIFIGGVKRHTVNSGPMPLPMPLPRKGSS